MEDVRPAVEADLDAVVELARAMRQELVGMRGGQLWSVREARAEPLQEAYAALLDQPARRFLVGTLEGVVVGFAVGEVEELRDGRRLGIVRDLFVEPPAREVGVGEAMVGELLAFFVAEGCAGVDAGALPGHRATKNFFEEQGFTARGIVMHRTLEG